MSMKRSPEWFAQHQARMRGLANCELVEVSLIGKPTVRSLPTPTVKPGEPYANLLVMFAERGIYPPVREYVFASDRKWRFDYAWPPRRVALEIDGGIWRGHGKGSDKAKAGAHSHPVAILRDIEKHNAATLLGWRVIRATPDKLAEAVAQIEMLLGDEAA